MNAAAAVLFALAAFACALADSAGLRAVIEGGQALPRPEHEARHRALLFARVVAHLGAGAATARALAGVLDAPWQLWTAVAGCALVAAALGEALARELGDALGARGPAAAARAAVVGRAAEVLLAPALWPAARLDAALRRRFPAPPPDEAARDEVAEQFREIVAAEAEGGAGEGALVAGVFELGDTQVSEVMVPRVDVVGVERTTAWSEVVARVRSAEHSRLPVYDETIDDIDGVLYAKDVLSAVVAGDEPAGGWTTLVRPAQFIPATKRVDDQLRDFRATGNHLAVVADEYGGTAGIVTIEDVLEEIVGEIRDERDDEEPPLEGEDGRRFWVSARVTLDELSDALGYDFRHDDVSTVGGLVYEVLGRVPRNGERLTVGPFRVIVERVVRRKIQRLYFEQLDAVVVEPPPALPDPGAPAPDGARARGAGERAADRPA
jgi:CBS domain containing-hemolysin-like protein